MKCFQEFKILRMKIAVLTQPLHDNYGGLLQAYALKEVLQAMGNEVVIINRKSPQPSMLKILLSRIKNSLLGKPKREKVFLTENQKMAISKHTNKFRKKYIPNLSELITNDDGMKSLNSLGFNAYVVGSDQCWRPKYSPKISNYFLDFLDTDLKTKRISYAASFGVSDWEFSEKDTKICKELMRKFDAISVRENSAIDLVDKYF